MSSGERRRFEAGMLSLEDDAGKRDDALLRIRALQVEGHADPETAFTEADILQRLGRHAEAITLYRSISFPANTEHDAWRRMKMAVSLAQLFQFRDAFAELDAAMPTLMAAPDRLLAGGTCLEASRIYGLAEQNDESRRWANTAADIFEEVEGQTEHWARARSNAAGALMRTGDPILQKMGLEEMKSLAHLKYKLGDFEGMANNFSQIGIYFMKERRFDAAIAYFRKDLTVSRRIGDRQGLAVTLLNLAQLYLNCLQMKSARMCVAEARTLREEIDDPMLALRIDHISAEIAATGRRIGAERLKEGPNAPCACGSAKTFEQCCGQADIEHEIEELPFFGGVSEDVGAIHEALAHKGISPTKLDFVLRETSQAERRLAWVQWDVQEGWKRVKELPDMCNHHLNAARFMAESAGSEPDAFHLPLACAMLSVSAAEAFVNTVSYFLHEQHCHDPLSVPALPPDLAADPMRYQKEGRLWEKWLEMGNALCPGHWPPPDPLWSDFNNLIKIRNELVHFKSSGYEIVAPKPKHPHPIIKGVPAEVQMRDVPHSWPVRLLTQSFAVWSVKTVEGVIRHFRRGYGLVRSR